MRGVAASTAGLAALLLGAVASAQSRPACPGGDEALARADELRRLYARLASQQRGCAAGSTRDCDAATSTGALLQAALAACSSDDELLLPVEDASARCTMLEAMRRVALLAWEERLARALFSLAHASCTGGRYAPLPGWLRAAEQDGSWRYPSGQLFYAPSAGRWCYPSGQALYEAAEDRWHSPDGAPFDFALTPVFAPRVPDPVDLSSVVRAPLGGHVWATYRPPRAASDRLSQTALERLCPSGAQRALCYEARAAHQRGNAFWRGLSLLRLALTTP